MKTDTASLEQLQFLLAKEKSAREAAEDKLAQKELDWQIALQAQAQVNQQLNKDEQERKWSERLFEDVVNNMPGIIFQAVKNAEGIFIFNFISPVLHLMLGEQITNTNQLLSFIHPDDRIKWMDSLESTYNRTKSWKLEIRILMPGDLMYWWYCSATPSYSPSGDLVYNGILLNITKQKEAELSLKESEKKWHFALEGSGDGLWEYDAINNQTSYSPVSKTMLGLNEEDHVNDTNLWRKNIHPDDLPRVEHVLANYESGLAESNSIQYRALNKDGNYEWIMDRGVVFSRDKNGKPSRFIGVHTNINKIKQTELELASTATKLTTLITNMQDGIMLEDENGVIILCNQALCNILEIPLLPENLIGIDVQVGFMHLGIVLKEFNVFKERRIAIKKKCETVVNEEFKLANGKFLSRDYAPLIIDGECKGHLWKYTDITQQKIAEQGLIAAEKRYRNLIDNMKVGLVEYDLLSNVLYANHTFYDMCGYNKEELDGNVLELLMENQLLAKKIKALGNDNAGNGYELQIITKNNENKWWNVSVAPRLNDQLVSVATICACLDITEQKKLEHELRQAKKAAENSEKAKDIFLANMSHEIRTPMNAIFGLTRLMEKTNLLPQQRFYLETIINSTSSLMVILNDILDFSKISAGKLSLERIGFRLPDIMASTTNMLEHEAQAKGVQLILENSQCCSSVLMGDPFRLKQVLMNLLTNALKFTSKGSVLVTCKNLGLQNGFRHILIQVKDTGKGMAQPFLKILFDKFTQEDESIARSYEGTGLGMSISKHLIDLMGGAITVESQENKGTTFNLDLYFEEGEETDLLMEEKFRVDISLLKNKHILVVEDNEMNQLVVQTVLEQNGMDVTIAVNGLEAVNMINDDYFDLVLMDMQMSVMDGLQATTIIRKTNKVIPIIALTANALQVEQNKCLAVGMNDFLAKPFDEQELLGILCKWLDKGLALTSVVIKKQLVVIPQTDIEPLFNLEKIQAISPGNTVFVEMLVKMFVDDANSTVIKIKEALEQYDYKTIKMLAHRIRPSIEQMDIPFVPQMKRIEELSAMENETGGLETLVGEFEAIIKKVVSALVENGVKTVHSDTN